MFETRKKNGQEEYGEHASLGWQDLRELGGMLGVGGARGCAAERRYFEIRGVCGGLISVRAQYVR